MSPTGLNPYFIGLSTLIIDFGLCNLRFPLVSILILLDYLLLLWVNGELLVTRKGLNPYFIGLSTLIVPESIPYEYEEGCLNPYFIGLSTLII